ncbi:MAG: hypothetical protein R3B70_33675 [Polyangiaceae bacterium]
MGWRRTWLGAVGAAAVLAGLGCGAGSGVDAEAVGPADCPIMTAAGKLPATVDEANTKKAGGASWTNKEIRARYVCWVTGIGGLNEDWKREGLSAEERAKRAYQTRHDARMTARAMMGSSAEVEMLRARDQEKYGNPDGPTFEWLVEKAKEKGLSGDAVYEEIVSSAQRTDAATNKAFGL